jgi:hypothetical protein
LSIGIVSWVGSADASEYAPSGEPTFQTSDLDWFVKATGDMSGRDLMRTLMSSQARLLFCIEREYHSDPSAAQGRYIAVRLVVRKGAAFAKAVESSFDNKDVEACVQRVFQFMKFSGVDGNATAQVTIRYRDTTPPPPTLSTGPLEWYITVGDFGGDMPPRGRPYTNDDLKPVDDNVKKLVIKMVRDNHAGVKSCFESHPPENDAVVAGVDVQFPLFPGHRKLRTLNVRDRLNVSNKLWSCLSDAFNDWSYGGPLRQFQAPLGVVMTVHYAAPQ